MASQISSKPRTHNEYTVGWVCALPKEQTAAIAMLDQRHADVLKPPNDPNTYTLGSIGKHNVVIACLPKGRVGNNPAANAAAWMISTFPAIKFGLLVGIGGGVPPKVRLGDVVVGTPIGQFPGVVQWDMGKAEQGSNFKRTGSLNSPPSSLLTALTRLETEHELNESKIPQYLDELKQKWPRLATKYLRSDSLEDVLFKADYGHVSKSSMDCSAIPDDDSGDEEENNCRFCDRAKVIKRKPRDMRVHYGLIASGNQVIKEANVRDKLNKELDGLVLCVEMEAAGLMNNFPCIVIRGICDYADSHKNKNWQEHAAIVATTFAKELLEYVQPSDVDGECTAKDILSDVRDGLFRIEKGIYQVGATVDADQKCKILDWLTPTNYGPQHSDFISRCQEGTGQWFLDSKEFQGWLNQSSQTLFSSGEPGVGKTIITSLIVHHLDTKFRVGRNIGIAYVYCNFQRQQEQEPGDILSSLLKQLLQERTSIPDSMKILYSKHEKKRTRPSLDEIMKELQAVIPGFSRAFIIFDALDEVQISNGGPRMLLLEIIKIQAATGVNLFATSRINDEIAKLFEGTLSLQIRATNEDVGRYLDGQMSLLQPDNLGDDIRDRIRREIIEAVDGMFLLAYFYMNNLINLPTRGHIKQALQDLAKGIEGLNKIYEQAIRRIEDQRSGSRELAKRILAWIVLAKRPLSTVELRHALAVIPYTVKLDEDYLPGVRILRSVCAGLVTVDQKSDIVRLVHYTTQEYFERTWTSWFPNAQRDIATTCVTYLSFDTFAAGFCLTDEEFETRLQLNPLYDYAARNWGHHVRAALVVEQLVVDFLRCEAKVVSSIQAMMALRRFSGYSQSVPKRMTAVHVAAYFGLEVAIMALFEAGHNPDIKDSHLKTPLLLATANSHESVVKLLLGKGGVDLNSRDRFGWTPLSIAAQRRYEAVIKLLLAKDGVDLDAKDHFSLTPLLIAAENGYEEIVELLLVKNGVDLNSRDRFGRTPLLLAIKRQHEAVIKLLLATDGVDPNVRNFYDQTPLLLAVANGYEAAVKLLLAKDGIDHNFMNKFYKTPLLLAVSKKHEAIVRLLLAKDGVDIYSGDKSGPMSLSLALVIGNEKLKSLLAKGVANPLLSR